MKYLPFKTLKQRIVIYKRMLTIWQYCKDNNSMEFPFELLPETNIGVGKNTIFFRSYEGDKIPIAGFCYIGSKLTGNSEIYSRKFFDQLLPELAKYRPTHEYSEWFDYTDFDSRINILKDLLNSINV